MNGEKIGAKKNNVRHASLRKIEKLINQQHVKDGKQAAQRELSARAARARRRAEQKLAQAQQEAQERQQEVQQPATPTIPLHEHGDHPTQTSREQTTLQTEAEALERLQAAATKPAQWPPVSDGGPPPLITQDDEGDSSDDDDDDESKQRDEGTPRRARKPAQRMLAQLLPPANISQMALHRVLGNALVNEASGIYTLDKLQQVAITYSPGANLEEMANEVVHPITKETMTKYAKIIKVPELRDIWLAAM